MIEKKAVLKDIFDWGKSILLVVLMFYIVNAFLFTSAVSGSSMEPTLHTGELVIFLRTGTLEMGDIVAFESNLPVTEFDKQKLDPIRRFIIQFEPYKKLVKRVVAGPGDRIRMEEGEIYINGTLLQESYISEKTYESFEEIRIPDEYYFLMGDNRPVSLDSRSLGLIHRDKIIGRSLVRIWPLDKIGLPD